MNENVLKEEISMLENQIRILQQENQELKADYGNKAQVERDMLQQENRELKEQLDYLRSGEYLNQLKFERNMLEDLVQEEKLSNEVYSIKKIMQANTRLAEKNQELKEQLEKTNTTLDTHNELIEYMKNQQKEFIEYMEEQIICYENHQNTNLGEYERNLYFDIYNDILEKYKEIIGG